MVLQSGPWVFNRFAVVLEALDINVHPSKVPLTRLPFWVRVFDLPYSCWSEQVARALGGAFAGYITSDRRGNNRLGAYFRFKVWIDVTVPLRRGQVLALDDGGQLEVFFQYEKLHNHCYICGFLDHVAKHCDKGPLAPEEEAPYGGLRAEEYDRDRGFSNKSSKQNRSSGSGVEQTTGHKEGKPIATREEDDVYDGLAGEFEDYEEDDTEINPEAVLEGGLDGKTELENPGDKRKTSQKLSTSGAMNRSHSGDGGPSKSSTPRGTKWQRKRSGNSSSAPDRSGTGATPPLKKMNTENGLGSAETARQSRPPQ
ncbi:uncharacterized protein LOC130719470 [Lotus japonicus]|uniref:uncharacterized protein LOC130719470 n=1 Tax=Lotus japonicus TaxID=34305 RepID=UPI00258B1B34|nr:uncharacterized protein LOC130719470 [Lotus japonicus]